MLLNESFLDSATRRESLFSKAKLTGYIPKGRRCARADLWLSVEVDKNAQPSSYSILIPKGTSFSAANSKQDQRIFYLIDDVFINKESETLSKALYKSDLLTVYEGKLQQWRFRIDDDVLNQRYIIKDKTIDIDTIRVLVTPPGEVSQQQYKLSTSVNYDEDSKIFYLSTNEDGYYEIVFGNNIFGKRPVDQSIIEVSYMSSNGETGNGCKKFSFNVPSKDIPTEHNIGNWEDFRVILPENMISSGGAEAESEEDLRFSIPHHNRRQGNLVTATDYRTLILSEFRNIDSINVWGGESNILKDYGKIYLSVKPKYSDTLTPTVKREIETKIIENHAVVGMQTVIIDPEYINIDLSVYLKIDKQKTNKTYGEIEREVTKIITDYNSSSLNRFDNFFSDVDLLSKITKTNAAIKSVYSKKILNKRQAIYYSSGIENVVYFGNPITPGIRSSDFLYGGNTCYFSDESR